MIIKRCFLTASNLAEESVTFEYTVLHKEEDYYAQIATLRSKRVRYEYKS